MANYKAISKVLKHEGGYVNDPDDKNGETYKGISRKNWKVNGQVDRERAARSLREPEIADRSKNQDGDAEFDAAWEEKLGASLCAYRSTMDELEHLASSRGNLESSFRGPN